MSCNVGQYIQKGDEPVKQVEELIHIVKKALPLPNPGRGHRGVFRPSRYVRLGVTSDDGDILELKAVETNLGPEISLLHQGVMLRKLHIHENHYNPGGMIVSEVHMHFPTQRYPLGKGPNSYAYPLDDVDPDSELSDMLEIFSYSTQTDIVAFSIQGI